MSAEIVKWRDIISNGGDPADPVTAARGLVSIAGARSGPRPKHHGNCRACSDRRRGTGRFVAAASLARSGVPVTRLRGRA